MKRLAAGLLSAILAFALTGPAPAANRGGTLVFARAIDSQFLDPVHTAQNADIWISLNLYDTLIQPTVDGKALQPGLAESYALGDDGKSVVLKLRGGLKFADGSPLELSDVKWS